MKQSARMVESSPVDPTGELWHRAMLAGEFERAWRITDLHRAAGAPDEHRMWDGTSLSGRRVMLRCLHGLGDAVQLLRYAPLIRSLAASLTVEVPPPMLEIAGCFKGVTDVVTWGERAPKRSPDWNVQIEINELPYSFRTTLDSIPQASAPYLFLPDGVAEKAFHDFDPAPGPRVGIAWESGPWDPLRSLPLASLDPLLRLPATFLSLQTRDVEREHQTLFSAYSLRSAGDYGDGLLALASVISGLDLVITVDTLAAHLAGALGRPVWLLLRQEADWRWMSARDDSPWYPTMRLFRQPVDAAPGGSPWLPVVAAVAEAFAQGLQRQEFA